MEYPLFALKGGDTKTRLFKLNGFKTKIEPHQSYGLATIHDKDIWIYCISKLLQSMYEGQEVSRTIRFTIYDYLVTTNRTTSGREYERTKDSLNSIDITTDQRIEARRFGLINSWKIVEDKDGRMILVEITLPEWLMIQ